MKSDLQGPGTSVEDVLAATDHLLPSLEILDTRILRADPETDTTRKVFDTIADNAANAGIVSGGSPPKSFQSPPRHWHSNRPLAGVGQPACG